MISRSAIFRLPSSGIDCMKGLPGAQTAYHATTHPSSTFTPIQPYLPSADFNSFPIPPASPSACRAAVQVASRLFIVWGIIVPVPGPTTTGGIPLAGPLRIDLVSLLTAWCLSEIIRYGFFALKVCGSMVVCHS